MFNSKIYLCLLPLLFACGMSEEEINDEIDDANYCEVVEDCEEIGTYCPFGCYITVNSAEAKRIKEMVEDYTSKPFRSCDYKCMEWEALECVEGSCEVNPE